MLFLTDVVFKCPENGKAHSEQNILLFNFFRLELDTSGSVLFLSFFLYFFLELDSRPPAIRGLDMGITMHKCNKLLEGWGVKKFDRNASSSYRRWSRIKFKYEEMVVV